MASTSRGNKKKEPPPARQRRKAAAPKTDANRDAFDARDLIYRPALVELPGALYPNWDWITPLDQGQEGACTGFGLAAIINYQLASRRKQPLRSANERVSPHMLFEQAKRFDQWPGVKYDYSSARGAMKAWFHTGACSEALWPAAAQASSGLSPAQQASALDVPLGAYYRVLPRRTDVHAALVETGVVFVAAGTHDGWADAYGKPEIAFEGSTGPGTSGHAFALVGYTKEGFLVQNSWGAKWGGFVDPGGKKRAGIALWRYADFDRNAWDLWVARLAIPLESLDALPGRSKSPTALGKRESVAGPPAHRIWGHYVHIDDGEFDTTGQYPTYPNEVARIVDAALTAEDGRPVDHVLLIAHGGLNTIDGAGSRVGAWREVFKRNRIGEIHFIWETGLVATIADLITGKKAEVQERVGGVSDWTDSWIEKLTGRAGNAIWRDMQRDAESAFSTGNPGAAGTAFLKALFAHYNALAKKPKFHLLGHSAGAILHGHLLQDWARRGGPAIDTLTLMAPACTVDFFFGQHVPQLKNGTLRETAVMKLDDGTEKDDSVAFIYRKSLLYLVSHAYENPKAVVPILGMDKNAADVAKRLVGAGVANKYSSIIAAPGSAQSASRTHGGFDNDLASMNHVLERVLGKPPGAGKKFEPDNLKGY
jgi:Papain family cysteine protease